MSRIVYGCLRNKQNSYLDPYNGLAMLYAQEDVEIDMLYCIHT